MPITVGLGLRVRQSGTVNGPLVTSIGHAGLRVEARGLRLLCDPWLSTGGAFLGSWFPFPDNSHLRSVPELLECDWVAVSHEHLDHMDLRLLAAPASVRVVIPAVSVHRAAAATARHRGAAHRGGRGLAPASAQHPRRLADGHPRAVADVPRRGVPDCRRRGLGPARQRRADHAGAGQAGDGRGRRAAGPDGRADVRCLLASDLLRLPAGGRGRGSAPTSGPTSSKP